MARAQGKLSINPWGELVENARAAASAASEAICICLAWPNGLDSRGLGPESPYRNRSLPNARR